MFLYLPTRRQFWGWQSWGYSQLVSTFSISDWLSTRICFVPLRTLGSCQSTGSDTSAPATSPSRTSSSLWIEFKQRLLFDQVCWARHSDLGIPQLLHPSGRFPCFVYVVVFIWCFFYVQRWHPSIPQAPYLEKKFKRIYQGDAYK